MGRETVREEIAPLPPLLPPPPSSPPPPLLLLVLLSVCPVLVVG